MKKLVRIVRSQGLAERCRNVLEISLQAAVGAQRNNAVPEPKDIWWRVVRRERATSRVHRLMQVVGRRSSS